MYFNNMQEARAHYDALRRKNEDIYQQTGIEKYEDARVRYEMIVQAMDAYLERQREDDDALRRRARNIEDFIAKNVELHDSTFTKDEVLRMLNKMIFM